MNKGHLVVLLGAFSLAHAWAGSQSGGDYTVNAAGTEAGDLTVQGDAVIDGDAEVGGALDVHGNLSLGATSEAAPREAYSFQYLESGTLYTIKVTATRPGAVYLWQDNAGGTAANKMKLDGGNVLSLYSGGTPTITLNPNTGNVSLSKPGGGLVLSDGKLIRSASDLRSSALYDSAGNIKLSIDGSGNLIVSTPATFQQALKANGGVEFAPGVALDSGNVAYLKDTLRNLGYGQIDSVNDKAVPIFGNSKSITSLKYDSNGNAYITGSFYATAAIGGTNLTSAGYSDVFAAKLDAAGNATWAKRFGGTLTDDSFGIAVDTSGNAYITGNFFGSATFGGTNLTSAGSGDVFVAKLDGSGNATWAKRFGGASVDDSKGIAVDASGNAYVIGTFPGTVTFGSTSLTSAGGIDVFVAKLDASGNVIWAKRFGGANNDDLPAIGVDAGGNAYIAGRFSGTAAFGSTNLTGRGSTDAFVAKLDASGNVTWAKSFGGTGIDVPTGFAVDGGGNAYLAGHFFGAATFGATNLTSAGLSDVFAVKLDASGNVTWANRFGGTSTDASTAIALDASGNAYLTGTFSGTAAFGNTNLTSTGGIDVFVAAINASGNVLSASRIGSSTNDSSSAIAVSSSGRVALGLASALNIRIGDQVAAGASVYFWPGGVVPSSAAAASQLAWGNGAASQTGAVALGQASLASGQAAFAAGSSAASGNYASSWGLSTSASGSSSTAIGERSIASGNTATAMGYNTAASGSYATAMGYNTAASGGYATALGNATIASGSNTTAMGQATTASGYGATALGQSTIASGDIATVLGLGTQAQSYLSYAMGRYNVGGFTDNNDGNSSNDGNRVWFINDSLLEVGNGISTTARSNALTLFKNGKLRTGGVAEFKGGVRIPPQGDLSMGEFITGNNPANLNPATGLKYSGE